MGATIGAAIGVTAAFGATAGFVAGSALIGAAVGGVTSAVTGGNIIKGVITGGLVGAAGAGISSAFGAVPTVASGVGEAGMGTGTALTEAQATSNFLDSGLPTGAYYTDVMAGFGGGIPVVPDTTTSFLKNPYVQGMGVKAVTDGMFGVAKGYATADQAQTQRDFEANMRVATPSASTPTPGTIGTRMDSTSLANVAASPELAGSTYKTFSGDLTQNLAIPQVKA